MARLQPMTSQTVATALQHSDAPLVLLVVSEQCLPCHLMRAVLERVAEETDGPVRLGEIEVSDAYDLAERYRIDTVPTLLCFTGGRLCDRVTGLIAPTPLHERLKELIAARTSVASHAVRP